MIDIWIKCENPATRRLYNAEFMDEPVEFSENGTANVPKDVGVALVENYESILKYEAEEDE